MTSDDSSHPGSPSLLERESAFDAMERASRTRARRQWALLLGFPILVVGCVLLYLSTRKPVYAAHGLVELMRGIDGADLGGRQNKRAIGNEIALLRTPDFQRRVLDELSPADRAALAGPVANSPNPRKKARPSGSNRGALAAIAGVVISRHSVSERSGLDDGSFISDTLLLEIADENSDPHMAEALVNATIRAAPGANYRITAQRIDRMTEFVTSKLTSLESRIETEEAEDRRLEPDTAGTFALMSMPVSIVAPQVKRGRSKRLRQQTPQAAVSTQIASVPPEGDPMLPVIEKAAERAEIEDRLSRTRLKLQQTLTAEESADMDSVSKTLETESLSRRLHGELNQARVEYQTLGATLGANHPLMAAGLARIDALQEEIAAFDRRHMELAKQAAAATSARSGVLHDNAVQERRNAAALFERQENAAVLELNLATDLNLLELMKEQMRNASLEAQLSAPVVEVVGLAPLPIAPVHQPKLQLSVLAGLAGTMVAFLMIVALQQLGVKTWTADQVEDALEKPVLAIVREFNGAPAVGDVSAPADPNHWGRGFEESVHGLRDAMPWLRAGRESLMILVTSAFGGDGATSTAAALGSLLARSGERVLLIDTNMRHPALRRSFHLSGTAGLSNVLAGAATLDEAAEQVLRLEEGAGSLHVLAMGPTPPNPFEALHSGVMTDLLREAKGKYRYVVLDGNLSQGLNGMVTSELVDAIFLVARYGRIDLRTLRSRRRLLQGARLPLAGAVINGVSS